MLHPGFLWSNQVGLSSWDPKPCHSHTASTRPHKRMVSFTVVEKYMPQSPTNMGLYWPLNFNLPFGQIPIGLRGHRNFPRDEKKKGFFPNNRGWHITNLLKNLQIPCFNGQGVSQKCHPPRLQSSDRRGAEISGVSHRGNAEGVAGFYRRSMVLAHLFLGVKRAARYEFYKDIA